MHVRVIYQSTTGNTKKVAEAIARAASCEAEPVSTATVGQPSLKQRTQAARNLRG